VSNGQDAAGKVWDACGEHLRKWSANYDDDQRRMIVMESDIKGIRVSTDAMVKSVERINRTLYGNGDPGNSLVVKVRDHDLALSRMVSARLTLYGVVLSVVTSGLTMLLSRLFH